MQHFRIPVFPWSGGVAVPGKPGVANVPNSGASVIDGFFPLEGFLADAPEFYGIGGIDLVFAPYPFHDVVGVGSTAPDFHTPDISGVLVALHGVFQYNV